MADTKFGRSLVEHHSEDFKMKVPLYFIGFLFLITGNIFVALVFCYLGCMAAE